MSNNKKTVEKHRRVQEMKEAKYEAMSKTDQRFLTWPMLHKPYSADLSEYGQKLKANGII